MIRSTACRPGRPDPAAPRRPSHAVAALVALGILPAHAQSEQAPINPEACVAIVSDAERLACYDRAMDRDAADVDADDPSLLEAGAIADALRRRERQALPPRERARRLVSDLFASEPATVEAIDTGKGSLLDSRWELAPESKLGTFNFRAYKPVYLMPLFWTDAPNEQPTSSDPRNVPAERRSLKEVEAKFQLSFKTKLAQDLFGDNGDLWAGYTQSSRWQVYDGEQSRAFRETNHEPEVMLVFRNGYSLGGWRGRMTGIALNHQSNGRADPESRSWNRIIVSVGLDRRDWALVVRPWWRIPDPAGEDENPDIEDYIGRGDLTLVHRRNGHEFALAARHSLRTGDDSRGAVQFDWGFPLSRTLRGHLQVFDGYGESLIDYDHRGTWVGLGVSLLEWY